MTLIGLTRNTDDNIVFDFRLDLTGGTPDAEVMSLQEDVVRAIESRYSIQMMVSDLVSALLMKRCSNGYAILFTTNVDVFDDLSDKLGAIILRGVTHVRELPIYDPSKCKAGWHTILSRGKFQRNNYYYIIVNGNCRIINLSYNEGNHTREDADGIMEIQEAELRAVRYNRHHILPRLSTK